MEQLDILWKYQELDLIMEQCDHERKNSNLRHKLLKIKNYLVDQDEYLVKLDSEADRKNNFFHKIQHEYDNIINILKAEKDKIESGEAKSIKELEQMVKEGLLLKDKLQKKDDELSRLLKEVDVFQKKLNDIRLKVTKAKKEYSEVKKEYDKEVLKLQQELANTKEKRDQLLDDIDETLIVKYNNLKISRSPVISTIVNDQCSGCYMSLASLVIQNVKDRKRIVECENCGRFLYYKA